MSVLTYLLFCVTISYIRYSNAKALLIVLDGADWKDWFDSIQLFKMTKQRDCKLFPELAAEQAYEWMIRPNQNAEDKIAVRAYQALLVNRGQRKRILGF